MMQDLPWVCEAATASQEQRWNETQLAQPVTSPHIRFWCYRDAGLVLGCSQRGLMAKLSDDPMPVLVRHAGGGAVIVGPWMLSISVIVPPGHGLASKHILWGYQWLGECLAGVLRGLGVNAHAMPPQEVRAKLEAQTPDKRMDWACFAGLSPWEVVVDGRKLVGLAQVRRRTGTLITAGILTSPPDWALLCNSLAQPLTTVHDLVQRTTSVSEILGRAVEARDLYPAFALAVNEAMQGSNSL